MYGGRFSGTYFSHAAGSLRGPRRRILREIHSLMRTTTVHAVIVRRRYNITVSAHVIIFDRFPRAACYCLRAAANDRYSPLATTVGFSRALFRHVSYCKRFAAVNEDRPKRFSNRSRPAYVFPEHHRLPGTSVEVCKGKRVRSAGYYAARGKRLSYVYTILLRCRGRSENQ